MKDLKMLGKARVEQKGDINILHLYGTPYQMGYQHGCLLANEITLMIQHTLLATAAYVAAQTGTDNDTAMQMLWKGQQAAYPFLPPECLEEMKGIHDGAIAAGASVTLEDILLWNTNYDQWCIYAHPHYWPGGRNEGTERHFVPHPHAGGCSSFCAWDEWAGGDGKLIFGKNEDNFNMPDQLENRFLIVASPDGGYAHTFMTYPGMIGLDGGFNDQGFEMMTQLNSMQYESMEGCGIGIFTRLLLTHASTVDDAIAIFNAHPRCAGIAYHVADAKAKKAAVVETSSKHVCVRYPMPGIKALWQSNHSNCYPGWQGYSGYNMVADQVLVNEIKDISTIEAWQTSLKDPYNFYVQAPSRFERYEQLIHQYYGQITVDNAITMLSDCYDPYSNNTRPKQLPSWTNNVLCTICAMYPDFSYVAKAPVGPFKAHVANMWSMIAYPETGDFWLAVNGFPAQYGGYEHFNLKDMLSE